MRLCWACTCHAAFTPVALHHQARSLRRHGRLLAVTDQPSRNSSSDAAADSAAAGIGTRLADLNSLLGRFRDNSALDLFRDKSASLPSLLDQVASAARVDVAYLVVAAGTVLYVYLNRAAKDLTIFQFDSPEADVVAARVLAVAAFALVQQAAGLDPRSWLRLRGEPAAAADAGGPLGSVFALPTPVAGVAFALLFVLPVAALSAAGVRLLPVYGTTAWSKCPCLPAAAHVAVCLLVQKSPLAQSYPVPKRRGLAAWMPKRGCVGALASAKVALRLAATLALWPDSTALWPSRHRIPQRGARVAHAGWLG